MLPSNVTLLDTAELFAKLQLAFYDGNIQGWFIKYTTLFWRPVTAIRCVLLNALSAGLFMLLCGCRHDSTAWHVSSYTAFYHLLPANLAENPADFRCMLTSSAGSALLTIVNEWCAVGQGRRSRPCSCADMVPC